MSMRLLVVVKTRKDTVTVTDITIKEHLESRLALSKIEVLLKCLTDFKAKYLLWISLHLKLQLSSSFDPSKQFMHKTFLEHGSEWYISSPSCEWVFLAETSFKNMFFVIKNDGQMDIIDIYTKSLLIDTPLGGLQVANAVSWFGFTTSHNFTNTST